MTDEIIDKVLLQVEKILGEEKTGHDIFHILRVKKIAEFIAAHEKNVDAERLALICFLHDIDDRKVEHTSAWKSAADILSSLGYPKDKTAVILSEIDSLSYSSSLQGKRVQTLEGKIAQDADRIEALGAIGIARAFTYGGAKKREMWNKEFPSDTTLQHFYDKLLKLEELCNTATGKKLASQRTQIIKEFIREFLAEWEGDITL